MTLANKAKLKEAISELRDLGACDQALPKLVECGSIKEAWECAHLSDLRWLINEMVDYGSVYWARSKMAAIAACWEVAIVNGRSGDATAVKLFDKYVTLANKYIKGQRVDINKIHTAVSNLGYHFDEYYWIDAWEWSNPAYGILVNHRESSGDSCRDSCREAEQMMRDAVRSVVRCPTIAELRKAVGSKFGD
jgi:hypothetical protein